MENQPGLPKIPQPHELSVDDLASIMMDDATVRQIADAAPSAETIAQCRQEIEDGRKRGWKELK